MENINIKLFRIFNDLEEEKINEDFLNFLLELIIMDNKFILERFESFLGYPSLIIKSVPNEKSEDSEINNDNIKNVKKEYHQKWPLFGEKLINGDINRHIYEYKCKIHIKKNLCILSLLFPNDYDEENNKNKNINKNISEKLKKKLIIDILNNCLKEKNNYYLFKYIYLMPSRNLLYNNLYEEMISILKDEKIFDLEEIKIKEKNFIKRIENEIENSIKASKIKDKEIKGTINMYYDNDNFFQYMNNMDYFIGFKSDIIPGEIVREEISEIARNSSLSIQRIEYFTKYYKFDELRKGLLNKNKYYEYKIKKIDLEKQEKEKKEITKIFYDVSIRNENSLFYSLFKKTNDYYVLEDKSLENKIYSESTIIRYNLLNTSTDEKKFNAKIIFNRFKKNCLYNKRINVFWPNFIYGKVESNNYTNFCTIYKIRGDLPFIEFDDNNITIDLK